MSKEEFNLNKKIAVCVLALAAVMFTCNVLYTIYSHYAQAESNHPSSAEVAL